MSGHEESEKGTRRTRIDRQLRVLGWQHVPAGQPAPSGPFWRDEIETANGPCDYGLYVDGKLIGLIEAKRLSKAPQNVLSQTERYAQGVDVLPWRQPGWHRQPWGGATFG